MGAAMTEAVLLAPVMIAMWIGINYFRIGYARRLDALAQSHAGAWKLAMSNDGSCFAHQEPWAGFLASDPSHSSSELASGAGSSFKSNTTSSMFMYAHADVKVDVKTAHAHFDNDTVGAVHGETFITCNEVVPQNGTSGGDRYKDQNVLTPLWDFISSLFN
jgi:hypothetical protein